MTGMRGRHRTRARHQCVAVAVLLGALLFPLQPRAQTPGDSRGYRLAPGDLIAVTVFNQPDFSAELLVDDTGNIAVPFLDPVEVKGLTILECQKLVRDRLADGILQHPSVSVRIVELRPLYVMGDVRTPGEYLFRYGATVQSAVAAAGGFGPAELVAGVALSEFLLADERVRQLSVQQQGLLVRRARLEAQRDGAKTFSVPDAVNATEANDLAGMVANEQDIFNTQAAILQEQVESLRAQKPRMQDEVAALNGQIEAAKKQLELVKQHSDQYSRLVKQGLGLANSELQFKLTEASHESEIWRLTAQVSHLRKDIGDLDFKIVDTDAAFKRQVAIELRDVRDRLNELDVTLPTAREIRSAKLQYAGGLVKTEIKRTINVTRVRDGKATIFEATEATLLEPGDIIDVKRLSPAQAPRESAASGQTDWRPYRMRGASAARPSGPLSR